MIIWVSAYYMVCEIATTGELTGDAVVSKKCCAVMTLNTETVFDPVISGCLIRLIKNYFSGGIDAGPKEWFFYRNSTKFHAGILLTFFFFFFSS